MKRIVSLILSLALLASMMTLLTSCKNGQRTDTQFSAYYVGNLYDFDPAMNYMNDDALEVFNLIYDPLFYLNDDGSVTGALVEKYTFDEKTNKLTLTLRDTCWNDGTAILGDDVVYSWKRILACDFASPAASLLYDIKNAYYCKIDKGEDGSHVGPDDIGVSVDVKDSKKVIVELNEGADVDQFLRNLTNIAVTALDEDAAGSTQKEYWAKRVATIKTSGPFALKTLDYNAGYFTIGRNNYYRLLQDTVLAEVDLSRYVLPEAVYTNWVVAQDHVGFDINVYGDRPMLRDNQAKITKEYYEDFMAGLTEAYADTIFYMGEVPLDTRATVKDSAEIKTADLLSTYSYIFNLNNPATPLVNDARVRIGISKVIDRAAAVNAVVFGHAATGLITNGVYNTSATDSFRTAGGAILSIDSAANKGKQMIKAAIAALDADGVSYPTNKSGSLPVIRLLCRDNEEEAAIAEMVKAALSDVVELEIVYLSYTYIKDSIALEEGINANETTMVDDALVLAYTVQEDGGLYYYNYDDSARLTRLQYDMIAMDYQMFSTDAFHALAGFSSLYCGNGLDTTERNGEFTYNVKYATCGWYSEAYDQKMKAAYEATDAETRASLLHEAEALLLSEDVADNAMPIIPIMFNVNYSVVNPRLEGVTANAYGYFNICKAIVSDYDTLLSKDEETAE